MEWTDAKNIATALVLWRFRDFCDHFILLTDPPDLKVKTWAGRLSFELLSI